MSSLPGGFDSSDGPLYQVGTVAQLVGLAPATLRAWERRYGVPGPGRGDQGYRLYSDADVRTLRWLKAQIDSGLTIGRATSLLAELRAQGRDPAQARSSPPPPFAETATLSLADLARQCAQAVRRLDEAGVVETFRVAHAFYSFEDVMHHIMQPVLHDIGQDWAAGSLPVAVEHFASQQMLRQLWAMVTAAGPAWRPGVIVAGCAPGERHELGLLMVVVRLRWRGWDVKYLGAELSLERLAEALNILQPRLLLFSATRPETARALAGLTAALQSLLPVPPVLFGGQGFVEAADSVALMPGATVHDGHEDVAAVVERLAGSRPPSNGTHHASL